MSVEYRLALAAATSVEQVAEHALPGALDRRALSPYGSLLAGDLHEEQGFGLSIRAGHDDLYSGEDDDGSWWEWEPGEAVNLTFDLGDDSIEKGIPNMLDAVARVLERQPGDAALTLNFDLLLLTRVGGVLRKHNRARWWDHYGFVNDIIPD